MSSTMSSTMQPIPHTPTDGLAMLQAASLVLADAPRQAQLAPPPVSTISTVSTVSTATQNPPTPPATNATMQRSSPPSLTQLLNPSTANLAASLPAGFVLGKDGKIKKKRGRKPTPGLTDEGRRQARLLKNRRTAEISRRRKLALLNRLTAERNRAAKCARELREANQYLVMRLAQALQVSVQSLVDADARVAFACRRADGDGEGDGDGDVDAHGGADADADAVVDPPQSDVSTPGSVADSDDDVGLPPVLPTGRS